MIHTTVNLQHVVHGGVFTSFSMDITTNKLDRMAFNVGGGGGILCSY